MTPMAGSIERPFEDDDPQRGRRYSKPDGGGLEHEDRSNDVDPGDGDSERDLIRMGGRGF